MRPHLLMFVFGVAALTAVACTPKEGHAADRGTQNNADRIRPWSKNPRYWQYKGKPVLLIGGSKDDNLFQLPDLKEHLDEIKRAGGNYIRNTMSDRPNKGFEVYPFRRLPSGKYDLNQWNDEYWKRFENMLRWTAERDIIVQIEVWDRFDYSDHRGAGNWSRHPYNPKNNVNYTVEQSGLKTTYKRHPGTNEQPFFFTVPAEQNNQVVLKYQIAQVDKMLSYSLKYGNVLYCMDNETSGSPEWGKFWALHIKKRAAEAGVEVFVTEMWDQWNIKGEQHKRTLDHPEIYDFVDISQNNHNKGQKHWDNLQYIRAYVAKRPRPINCVKIYGADTGRFGNTRDGEERFWRNILGGLASSRFHRPDSGLGLSDRAKRHIKSMRMLTAELDIFRCKPDVASRLLSERSPNEAYLTYIPGERYAVYFPNGGDVTLDFSKEKGRFALKWLNILKCRWQPARAVQAGHVVRLQPPASGHWVALLTRAEP
ncbi:MAG: hypothetical protein GXP27_14475 [Planctomycetes bacterium]|nr:hypothetical protein [Planctomycetota bacterium]